MLAKTHPDIAALVAPLFAFGGKRGRKLTHASLRVIKTGGI
jgi:hypothetical protein